MQIMIYLVRFCTRRQVVFTSERKAPVPQHGGAYSSRATCRRVRGALLQSTAHVFAAACAAELRRIRQGIAGFMHVHGKYADVICRA